jgi:peptidoglycan/xylan/chitin deacetylase (PgdA/CDA1 family)
MRGGGLAQPLIALVGQDRELHARVVVRGRVADEAGTFEAVEQAGDPGRREQHALRQVDAAHLSAGRVREVEQDLVGVQREPVRREQLGAETPGQACVGADELCPSLQLRRLAGEAADGFSSSQLRVSVLAVSIGPVASWPGGARCAVAFTFDFDAEEVWLARDPANAARPGVLSQGTYGAKVAVPLILELLERHGLRATFFVPGRVAERHTRRVQQIVAAGHELGHHGYTHTTPAALTPGEEEDELVRAREILEGFGTRVVGYRSPGWDFSPETLALLERHGFRYSSNFMDDIRPYRHEATPIVELPVQWLLDDAPHFWFARDYWTKAIATTAHVRALWEEEFLGLRELGGLCLFTMHPQVIGRPSRLRMLDDLISFVRGHDDVWVAACAEIAEHVSGESS